MENREAATFRNARCQAGCAPSQSHKLILTDRSTVCGQIGSVLRALSYQKLLDTVVNCRLFLLDAANNLVKELLALDFHRCQVHLIVVSMDLDQSSFLMRVVAALTKGAVLLPREAPAVLRLVLLTQDADSLRDIQLVVCLAFILTVRKPTVVAHCAQTLLVICANDVRFDLDVGLVHAGLLLVARVVVVDHLVCVVVVVIVGDVVHWDVRR